MGTNNFQELLLNNKDYLRPFAFSFTRCDESANDLVQDTLLLAWKNQCKYNHGSNIRAWLFTIMRNSFINKYRRKKIQGRVEELDSNNTTSAIIQSERNIAAGNLRTKDILKLLAELPDIFKKPLQLYSEGYKYREIATVLSESEGTIKSRIHFGRKLLKEQLKRYC
jgi:RNA polymerase sigma factor (sigma-70 family)